MRGQSNLSLLVLMILSACVGHRGTLAPTSPPSTFAIVSVASGEQESHLLELRRVEQQMGGQTRSILEGKVSLDGAQAHRLMPNFSAGLPIAPVSPQGTQLYLVKVDFTLHKLTSRKICREMILYLSVKDPGTTLVDMFPRHLGSARKMPRSLMISRAAQLKGVADESGPFPVEALVPEVTGYRENASSLYWVFRPTNMGASVPQGAKSVFLLLRLPEQRTTTSLVMKSEADIGSYFLNELWWPGPSKTESRVITVRLK